MEWVASRGLKSSLHAAVLGRFCSNEGVDRAPTLDVTSTDPLRGAARLMASNLREKLIVRLNLLQFMQLVDRSQLGYAKYAFVLAMSESPLYYLQVSWDSNKLCVCDASVGSDEDIDDDGAINSDVRTADEVPLYFLTLPYKNIKRTVHNVSNCDVYVCLCVCIGSLICSVCMVVRDAVSLNRCNFALSCVLPSD